MAKKEKEKPVLTIDGKEYNSESLTDEQQTMVNHIDDLNRKIAASEFNLVQLRFGRQAFVDGLRASLESDDENK
jgi:hypothetical protein